MKGERERNRIFLAIIFSLAALIGSGYFIAHTFSAILTSVVIAYLVNPPMKLIEKRGFSRMKALCILYAIGLFIAFLASFFLVPYLAHQIDALVKALPIYIRSLHSVAGEWQAKMSGYYGGEEGAWVLTQMTSAIEQATAYISNFGLHHLKNLLFAGFNILLAPILVFFMLLYKQNAKDFIKRMFHHSDRQHLVDLGRELNRSLQQFLVGMFLDCLIVAVLTSIALAMLGIEFPLLNGFFAGFASIVQLPAGPVQNPCPEQQIILVIFCFNLVIIRHLC